MRYRSVSCVAALVSVAAVSATASAGGMPAELNLADLDGSNGFVLKGLDEDDLCGISVSSAGNFDGDQYDDLLLGAASADPNGGWSGETYLVYGRADLGAGGVFDLSDLDSSNGFVLNGIDTGDYSGTSVSSAGDINNDGRDDLIIGAPDASSNTNRCGESYVVFSGQATGTGGSFGLASLHGSDGFIVYGTDERDYSGGSVSGAGDINGDGDDDFLIGVAGGDPNASMNGETNAGETFVIFGGEGVGASGSIQLSDINGANGFVINGIDIGDGSGSRISSAGDVNDDGYSDILIGAYNADPAGVITGAAYVVFGGPGVGANGAVELSSLDGTNGFVLPGIDADDHCGLAVAPAGDVDGDGVDDLIIGAFSADPNGGRSGESYVIFGSVDVGSGGSIDLSTLDGESGFVLHGVTFGSWSGYAVSSGGDLNGDGYDDLVIGARQANTNGNSQSGRVYVVYGGPSVGARGTFELSEIDGVNGYVINGVSRDDHAGFSVSSAGDLNADGFADLIIGALYADPDGVETGAAYVVFGAATPSPADFSGDGCVDGVDLAILLASWGSADADVNGDLDTNSLDLAAVLAAWSNGCG